MRSSGSRTRTPSGSAKWGLTGWTDTKRERPFPLPTPSSSGNNYWRILESIMAGKPLAPAVLEILERIRENEKDRTLTAEQALYSCNWEDPLKVSRMSERQLLQYALLVVVNLYSQLEQVYEGRLEVAENRKRLPNRAQRRHP